MIQVFCAKRGSGKSKKLINLANESLLKAKGDCVYIDDDTRRMRQLKGKIRFIDTNELNVIDCDSFYGLLCGVVSQNYDIENIYIDALSSIIDDNIESSINLFKKLHALSEKFDLNIFINLNCDDLDRVPDFIRKFAS